MFASNVREIMTKKGKTVRDLVKETGMSSRTIQRAVSDETIHKCELGTLGRIAEALGVKTKHLYAEVEGGRGVEKRPTATEKSLRADRPKTVLGEA